MSVTTEGQETAEIANLLAMSDEEAMNYEFPEETVEDTEEAGETDATEETGLDDSQETTEEEETEVGEQETEEEGESTEQDPHADGGEESDPEVDTEKETTEGEVNFEEEHKKLLAPFKANNREFSVDNVDEARTLMQKGANYDKKMSAIKPNMKLLKMLENNGLLDENKLNYLIDIDKKNPDAIAKLFKDSGINPLEVDVSEEAKYNPNTYTVDDRVMNVEEVFSEIRDTDSYAETIDIINNKWDAPSQKVLLDNPQYIKAINEQVGAGVFEQIASIVEKERMLGRLTGLSDIDAYKSVGDALLEQGEFNKPTAPAPKPKPKVKQKSPNPKLIDRKKAASPTKGSPGSTKKVTDYNPLSMSDEEFEKQISGKFT